VKENKKKLVPFLTENMGHINFWGLLILSLNKFLFLNVKTE